MKKKKNLVLFIVIILVAIGVFFCYWQYSAQKIRKKVLNSLEESLELCEIVKDSVSFNKGKFWLICNGRPFYTTYANGNLSYELNGWGWLKDTNYWNELKGLCDVYYPEGNTLRFFCYENNIPKLKYYSFDKNSFAITEVKEENFVDVLTNDLKNKYPFLSDCMLRHFTTSGTYSPSYELFMLCKDQSYKVKTDLSFVIVKPVYLNQNNVITFFENIFNIKPEVIDSEANATLDFGTLAIDYSKDLISLTPSKDINIVINEMGDKFLINFQLTDPMNIRFVREETNEKLGIVTKTYMLGEKIIDVYLKGNIVQFISQSREGFYEQ